MRRGEVDLARGGGALAAQQRARVCDPAKDFERLLAERLAFRREPGRVGRRSDRLSPASRFLFGATDTATKVVRVQ